MHGEDGGNPSRIFSACAAQVNPLAGCLPTLATIPVFIGLYRALSNVAEEGLLKEGFFWIPSLGGPTTLAIQKAVRVLFVSLMTAQES
jgi:membrane protein insertase Oxa1/YidC/SpoIIIJ